MVSAFRFFAICAALLLVGGGAWRLHQAGFSAGVRACDLAHAELAARKDRADAAARQRAAIQAAKAEAAAHLEQLRRRDLPARYHDCRRVHAACAAELDP